MNSHEFIGYSIRKLIIWKYWTLRRFLGEVFRTKPWMNRSTLSRTRSLKGKYSGPAFIGATGPSLNEVPAFVFEYFSSKAAIFGVNHYVLTSQGQKYPPTFQIIIDQAHFNQTAKYPIESKFQDILKSHPPKFLIQIAGSQDFLEGTPRIDILGHVLPSFVSTIDPTQVCGFVPNSTLFAISTALHLGFSPIYVGGFDYDQFRHAFVDLENGGVYLEEYHAYNTGRERETWPGRENATDLLNSTAFLIYSTRLFRDFDVRLIGNKGIIDTFRRETLYNLDQLP